MYLNQLKSFHSLNISLHNLHNAVYIALQQVTADEIFR